MDLILTNHVENIKSKDKDLRYGSFQFLIQLTQHPVDCAYEVWDDLIFIIKNW
ncbi:MAG: hypothetical protein JWQ14_2176 [Adhaeribacter sp.]|nr:hypothetical protein [Adhaeribacter sp.]